jgi:hypothetical protein
MIPDFFIVGATKCGTFTLHEYLDSLPEIEMSQDKEPYTFCSDTHLSNLSGLYEKQFNGHTKYKGESNANNLVIGYVPDRIFRLNPNAKIIILTRDPVQRAYSHWKYMYELRPGMEYEFERAILENARTFNLNKFELESDYVHTAIKEWGNSKRMYLETGFYENYIPNYGNLFDTLVLDSNELNSKDSLDKICSFLNVKKCERITRNRNVKGGDVYRDYPKMAESLSRFYATKDLTELVNNLQE